MKIYFTLSFLQGFKLTTQLKGGIFHIICLPVRDYGLEIKLLQETFDSKDIDAFTICYPNCKLIEFTISAVSGVWCFGACIIIYFKMVC